jgi:DNA-binding response OmpR family regulator/anti-sigma regulatory factor (Ser/Thr protein kinase)
MGGGPESRSESAQATLLVVDDEPLNRELIHALLPTGYRILDAESGPDALEILDNETVDLVLLDVMLPGMSGFDVCRALKALRPEPEPFLPVILVTALSDQRARNSGLEAGADDFLVKPVNRRELLLRVEAFLRLRRQDRLIRSQIQELNQLRTSRDSLVSLLVRDVRNSVASLTSTLSIASDTPGATLAEASRASQRLKEAVDRTLCDRLRDEAHLAVSSAPSEVEPMLAAAAATLEPLARSRRITVRIASDRSGIRDFDATLAQRAVENLLANALQYGPPGGDVVLSAHDDGGGLLIRVADRGPGLSRELKETLFARALLGDVPVQPPKGTGLYLARLIAESHGGYLSVRDREGGGSVFDLVLREAPQKPARKP